MHNPTLIRAVLRTAAAAAIALAAASAHAAVTASGAWIRWLPADLPAGGYVALHNDGAKAVSLVGASSPVYGMVMLHQSRMHDGKMEMIHVDAITVPAHGEQALKPGGFHIMLLQPHRDVHPGMRVPLELKFDDGERVKVEFEVRQSDGDSAPGATMHGMAMQAHQKK